MCQLRTTGYEGRNINVSKTVSDGAALKPGDRSLNWTPYIGAGNWKSTSALKSDRCYAIRDKRNLLCHFTYHEARQWNALQLSKPTARGSIENVAPRDANFICLAKENVHYYAWCVRRPRKSSTICCHFVVRYITVIVSKNRCVYWSI